MLINVKMPTIVGILTFMSRINFVLIRVEYEKNVTSGPGCLTSLELLLSCGYQCILCLIPANVG